MNDGELTTMTLARRRSSFPLYALRPVTVAILAALLMLTTTVGDSHAQSSAPAAPTGLTASSVSHDSVTLGWDDPGDGSITGYLVLRRDIVNQAPGTFSTVEPNTGSAATSYTDSTVSAETRYVYRVKAINASGTSEQSNYVNVETPAAPTPSVPEAPTGLTASSVSHDSVTLSWDDPDDSSITGYQVLRRSRDRDEYGDGQGAREFVAVVDDTGSSATTYDDTSVAARARYVYRVKAINSAGMSERSGYLNVETAAQPAPEPTATPEPTPTPEPATTVPEAPTGLTSTSVSHDSVTLEWDDPGDDGITGYQVLRRSVATDPVGSFTVLEDDTGSATTTYTDSTVDAETRYAYRVKARNSAGLSGQSSRTNVKTLKKPADLDPSVNPRQPTDATINWIAVDGTAVPGVAPDRTSYEYGVASTVTRVTISASTTDSENASWDVISPADASSDIGHQVDLSAGKNTVTIRGTAADSSTQDYTLNVNRGVTTNYGWKAVDDLDTLIAAGNSAPRGIWSNGATTWITDQFGGKIYAYNADGSRNSGQDFDTLTAAGNDSPTGIWSDGTTMWVADTTDQKLYAYTLSTKASDSDKDIALDPDNSRPAGIWSDGTTMWVVEDDDTTLYAYTLSSRARDNSRDIDLHSSLDAPWGIWSDGVTMWVADNGNEQIQAYRMSDSERIASRDFNTLSAADNSSPAGLWSDGITMWAVDTTYDKVYSYNMPRSTDATLSGITVDGTAVPGFASDRTSYEYGVASTVTQVTIAASTTDGNATWSVTSPADASTDAGHQVALSAGRNTVTIRGTAEDTATTQDYTLNVNRGVTDDYGWKAVDDFDTLIAAGNLDLRGIWSDGATMWVVDQSDRKLYAYSLSTRARDDTKDIDLHSDNADVNGIWSDGTTMWVDDDADDRLYAYNLSTRARDDSKDIDLSLTAPTGIWSDGTTMWVADHLDASIYAYDLSTRARDDSKDIDLHSNNAAPFDIWSDGTTMWVTDTSDNHLFAYTLSSKARDSTKEFNTLAGAGNDNPRGIWSDGTTMWVADVEDDKVYSYNMPPSTDATLSALALSPRDLFEFDPDRTSYDVGVASTVAQATVSATPNHPGAAVAYSGTDASTDPGHQVALSAGRNSVTVTVTATDGNTTKTYTVSINRGVTTLYGWAAQLDFDWLAGTDNLGPRGLWANGSTVFVADFDDVLIYAYDRDGTPDTGKDIDVSTDNGFPNGIWSDGTTMWVADSGVASLKAYTLANGNRNSGADIDLGQNTRGVWGNSTTVWAVNTDTDKLEAYVKSSGADDNDKDIDLDSANDKPRGIWSDGTTMWVADSDDNKLYAYTLSGGARDSSKDIDTSGSGNEDPRGLWGDGETIWATDDADDKVYAYNLPNDDATLSALTVSPKDIIGFDTDRTSYEVGVASTVTQATVVATPSTESATVAYSGTDASTDAGHQVALSAGRNEVTVTVTATDGVTTKAYTVSINRGVTTDYGWKASDDLDGLIAAGNRNPTGIWSDGATTWVVNQLPQKIYAYNADGSRNSGEDFDTLFAAGNRGPRDIWSDGTTMWVADHDIGVDRLYAYSMSTKAHDTDKDIELHSDNDSLRGIWSDGTTVWVADAGRDKLFAYNLATEARDPDKEIDLHSDNGDGYGIWSDGYTMWVSDRTDGRVYAYRLLNGERTSNRDFTTLTGAGNSDPRGIWSDGATMWVTDIEDDKVYSFNLPPSGDDRLATLSVSPRDIIGFDPERTDYEVGVASAVAQATITATKSHADATIAFSAPDADTGVDGHQVDLSAGRNEVTITVTAEDMASTEEYTVSINRGVTASYGWKASDDLDGLIAAGNTDPTGIWSDGTTTWVADSNDTKLYAYNSDGTPDSSKDIDLHFDRPGTRGIWSDGTTMWVADTGDDKLYAYTLSSKARDATKDIDLHSDNDAPLDMWSDGTSIWVLNAIFPNRKLFAYNLSTRTRDSDKDIDLHSDNSAPGGTWSDGFIIWVSDSGADKLFAYRLDNANRVSARDFSTLAGVGNERPRYIWSDGDAMLVVDVDDDKVYSFNMPPSADSSLSALAVSPRDIIGFDPGRASYQVGVASTVTQATVRATANHPDAMVTILPADASAAPGHQIDLSSGRNLLSITVFAEDPTLSTVYVVSINRGVTTPGGWKAADDLDGLRVSGNDNPVGIWSDGTTTWVTDWSDKRIYAYNADGTRNPGQDFDTLDAAGNDGPRGIWSDGQTMWVSDSSDDKLYAYSMSTKAHDSDKDIDMHSDNDDQRGLWSNGTTLWVVDREDNKLYAYTLSNGNRDSDKDIDLHSDNAHAFGIWSDGVTIWISDDDDNKLFAYTFSTKARNPTRDFDALSGAGNHDPAGIWSDGATMLVVDNEDDKVYSFNMFFAPVGNLRAVPGNRRVALEWDSPANSTPIRYQYRVSADGGSNWNPDWTNIPGSGAGTTSYTLTGLTNGAEHTFQVRPIYSQGGQEVRGPGAEVRSIPRGALRAPANLTATPTTDGEIALEWNDPSDATIEGYQYRHRNPSDTGWNPDWTDIPNSDAGTTTHTLTGLTNFVSYTFEVRAKRDASTFGPAARRSATPRGPLVTPANFDAEAGLDRRVRLSWDRSNDDSITVYQYRYRVSSSSDWNPDWTDIPGSGWQTSAYTVRSLLNRVSYTFEVRAKRGNLEGPVARASAEPEGPPEVPGVPRNLSVDNRDGALSLGWQVPGFIDSRAPVTSNLVRHREQGSSRWTTVSVPRSTAGTSYDYHEITNLTNRRHYEVQVAAVNRIGTGAWASVVATPQGPAEPPPPPPDNQTEDRDLNVGPLGAHWTDRYGSDDYHPDTVPLNINSISNDCSGTFSFKVFWAGPGGDEHNNRPADQYQAHVTTQHGAGEFSYEFRNEFNDENFIAMYGRVSLAGYSILTVRIRSFYEGEGWGTWSPPVGLYCSPE